MSRLSGDLLAVELQALGFGDAPGVVVAGSWFITATGPRTSWIVINHADQASHRRHREFQ